MEIAAKSNPLINRLMNKAQAFKFHIIDEIVNTGAYALDADDIYQETYLRLIHANTNDTLEKTSQSRDLMIKAVIKFVMLDAVRKREYTHGLDDEILEDHYATVDDSVSDDIALDTLAVRQAIELLDNRLRTVVELIYYEGMSQAEVGRHLGTSQQAVSKLHERALGKMGGMLE